MKNLFLALVFALNSPSIVAMAQSPERSSQQIIEELRDYMNSSLNKMRNNKVNCLEQSIFFNPFEGGACNPTIYKNYNCPGQKGKLVSSVTVEIAKASVTKNKTNTVTLFSPKRDQIADRVWGILGQPGPFEHGWPSEAHTILNDTIESINTINDEQAFHIKELFVDLIRSCRNLDSIQR